MHFKYVQTVVFVHESSGLAAAVLKQSELTYIFLYVYQMQK